MYAQWKPNVYTVTYNANGGSGSMANTKITYGTATALRTNAFTKNGHQFDGWNAHRKSDDKWAYRSTYGSVSGWYKEGEQPSGIPKKAYPHGSSVATNTSVNHHIVTM